MPLSCFDKWVQRDEGATAIEFAFLAVPFALLLVGIIEIGLLLAHASILEGAANDGARLIRTGQVQDTADPEEALREAMCSHAALMDCERLQFHVQTLENFGEADEAVPVVDEDGNMVGTSFDAGGSGDIVLVRVNYLYPMMTPLIGTLFSNYPGNRRMLMSTVVMQTEPYEF